MSDANKNAGTARFWSPVVRPPLVLAVALMLALVLAGCGTGSQSGNSDQGRTDGDEASALREEPAETTGHTSGNDGELGTPALGDPGAPVVMVEYSDYQ